MKSFWQRAPRHKRFYRGPARNKAYLRWVRTLPCLICGGESEAAHTGRDGGASQKSSDYSAVPLCSDHHTQAGKAYHRGTRRQFEQRYGIDLVAIAQELRTHYERRTMPNYEPVLRRQQGELFDPLELEHGLELECKCVQVDADEFDARGCPEHGAPAARRQLEQEAAQLAAFYADPLEEARYDRFRLTPEGAVLPVDEEAA